MYPHLRPLYDSFTAVGWTNVADYKTIQNLGVVIGCRWNDPREWPPGGLEETRQELAKILISPFVKCPSLP